MASELIMNVTAGETRIARLDEGAISELYIERAGDQQIVGNVYKGIVTRVLPGMQSAFVDIGLEKAAFLYVTDVVADLFEGMDEEDEPAADSGDEVQEGGTPAAAVPAAPEAKKSNDRGRGRGRKPRGPIPKIEDLLKEGQTVVVQVAKEPIRTKGARITCHISFPGRYLVYMPTVDRMGVSKRVGSFEERQRLKSILQKCRPSKGGFIARTVSAGATEEALAGEVANLQKIWSAIHEKQDKAKAPSMLYQDLGLVLRSVRDLMGPEFRRLVIDSREDHEAILNFMGQFMPELASRVELYDRETPLFDIYGIETEINRALGKKVWLKSGGYLVVDQNEALTSIDVNTGRFVGRDNFEETILQTNLEAAEEIAYQLRLRNIGGIIILDFIDMERYANRQKVFYALKEALRRDRVRTTITKISDLGLVEMTRKRTREALVAMISESCPHCQAKGTVKSPVTMVFEIFRELKRTSHILGGKAIVVHVNSRVAQVLFNEERARLDDMEKRYGKRIVIEPSEAIHIEKFEITTRA